MEMLVYGLLKLKKNKQEFILHLSEKKHKTKRPTQNHFLVGLNSIRGFAAFEGLIALRAGRLFETFKESIFLFAVEQHIHGQMVGVAADIARAQEGAKGFHTPIFLIWNQQKGGLKDMGVVLGNMKTVFIK